MKKLRPLFVLFFSYTMLCITLNSVHAEENVVPSTKKVTVLFKDEIDTTLLPEVEIEYNFSMIPAISTQLTDEQIQYIKELPQIIDIIEEAPIKIDSVQEVDWGQSLIGIPKVHESNIYGTGVKVAVLDSGIDSTHPDLFVVGGYNFIDDTVNYLDDNGHGTHIAGIIAASDNDYGVLGVSPKAKLYSLKVMDENGEGSTIDLAEAIDWSIKNNMDILNMSFGYTQKDYIIESLLDEAYEQGLIMVSATGNQGISSVAYPAKHSSVIAVGAINEDKKIATFSNRGAEIEVTAPGVEILSTYLNHTYALLDGTSMSTAYVSGYLSLLKEAYPNKSNVELRKLLIKNVLDFGATGRDSVYGYGVIQSFLTETPPPTEEEKHTQFHQLFKVTEDHVPIYDNRYGSLKIVGYLTKGQVYKRVSDYGNWHRISFGSIYGYVKKSSTEPINDHQLGNLVTNTSQTQRTLVSNDHVTVYDNSTGHLVPFATIIKGTKMTIASDYGNWVKVLIGDRLGYVLKKNISIQFSTSDLYFKVTSEVLPIYENRSGKLIEIGTLKKGQTYKRVSDYGSWHKIQIGADYGFVWKASTQAFVKEPALYHHNYRAINRTINIIKNTTVYDNSTGKLVPFATLKKGASIRITSDYGKWVRVIVSGRIGYIQKSDIHILFNRQDQYFQPQSILSVYENRNGKLVEVGTLSKGQTYKRISDYGSWHKIQFSNVDGFVWKDGTTPLLSSKALTTTSAKTVGSFRPNQDVVVYDNSSGQLVPIGIISTSVNNYQITSFYGNWYEVLLSGRAGYVYKGHTSILYR